MFKLAVTLLSLAVVAIAVNVNFNCANIPETCKNMCYHANNFGYFQMVFDDPSRNVKGQRRTAAGCGGNNRCKTNPPTNDRTTCDEYPFASTTGWYAGTGAGTRCVSRSECNSQGGSISAAYQSFGRVAGTVIEAVVEFDPNDPNSYCANPSKPSDGQFAQGVQPPVRRGLEPERRSFPPAQNWYRLKSGRKVLAIGRELANGTNVLIPKNWWDSHPELAKRQDDSDNDDCAATTARMMMAVRDLSVDEVAWFDPVVERINV